MSRSYRFPAHGTLEDTQLSGISERKTRLYVRNVEAARLV